MAGTTLVLAICVKIEGGGVLKPGYTMELWSNLFLDEGASGAPDWATCSLNVGTWRRVTAENEEAKRLFARIRCEQAGTEAYCALGSPVQGEGGGSERLFVPQWVLERLGLEGTGEGVSVEWLSEEAFPEATRIVLRPHDSAFYHADAKEELERGLTRMGVLTVGATVTIPIEELGGFQISFDIVAAEPANVVLAQGDEVALEFEEPLDGGPGVPAPPATPAASEIAGEMLPAAPPPLEPAGQRLGGAPVRRMADGRPWNPWRDGPKTAVPTESN